MRPADHVVSRMERAGGAGRRTWRHRAAIVAGAAVLAALAAGASASAAPDAVPMPAHADPRAIDRLAEMPAPRSLWGKGLSGPDRLSASATDVLGALPGAWCGEERGTDDTSDEAANGDFRYHAIYALPSDAVDRFATVASTLQADAFQASGLLERLYGRAIRFDLGTACGPQYVDISVVRLPERAAALSYLAPDASTLVDRVAGDLRSAGFAAHGTTVDVDAARALTKNYVVWLEGVTPPGGVCGAGSEFDDTRRSPDNFNNMGGQVAVVFRAGTGFCNSNTVRHEIGHNLGALLPGSPHAFDGSHCDDAYEDTMCYPLAPQVSRNDYQGEFFDYGNDDYWDPAGGTLPRWTVDLNRFICPDVACNVSPHASGPLAALGGALRGMLVSCPQGAVLSPLCPANTTSATRGEVGLASAPVKVSFSARRATAGRWRIHAWARGAGTARVTVRCRRRGRTVRVLARRLSAPHGFRRTVACDGHPAARASRS